MTEIQQRIERKIDENSLRIVGHENLKIQLDKLKNDTWSFHNTVSKTKEYFNIIKNLNVSIQERMDDSQKELKEVNEIRKLPEIRNQQWRESDNIWYKVALTYDRAINHLYSVFGSMNWQWKFLTEENAILSKMTELIEKSYDIGEEKVRAEILLEGLKHMKEILENQAKRENDVNQSNLQQQGAILKEGNRIIIDGLKEALIGKLENGGNDKDDSKTKKKTPEKLKQAEELLRKGWKGKDVAEEVGLYEYDVSPIKKRINAEPPPKKSKEFINQDSDLQEQI